MEGFNVFLNKKVFVRLKNGRMYSGIVLEITESGGVSWFLMNDRYDHKVCFVNTEIEVIEEEK
jgi:hypothetical protein